MQSSWSGAQEICNLSDYMTKRDIYLMWIFRQLGHTYVPNSNTQSEVLRVFIYLHNLCWLRQYICMRIKVYVWFLDTKIVNILVFCRKREKGMSCMNPFYPFNMVSIRCCSIVFMFHHIGELFLVKIIFTPHCPLSLFWHFCMICLCWAGSGERWQCLMVRITCLAGTPRLWCYLVAAALQEGWSSYPLPEESHVFNQSISKRGMQRLRILLWSWSECYQLINYLVMSSLA